jgi:hypothetical protein
MNTNPCRHCGKLVLAGVPICRWCKKPLSEEPSRDAPVRSGKVDPEGRRYLSGQAILLCAFVVVVLGTVVPRGGPGHQMIPIGLGILCFLIGKLLAVIGAFKVSTGWGFVVLFVPLGTLCFLASHFDEVVTAALLWVAGVALIFLPLLSIYLARA